MHIGKLRKEGMDHLLNFLKWAADRRIKKVGAILRKPLRRVFPYRYRIETIADTWNEAFVAYDPTPYPGDAMLFRASTGFVLGNDVGRLNGWERLIVGNVEVNECPGDHSTMCEQPHVRVLARRLGSYLRRQVSDNKFREPDVTTSNERKQSPLLVEADRARESSTNPALTS